MKTVRMSEDDEFGELYSDLTPGSTTLQGTGLPGIVPRHKLFEDDGAEEKISSVGPVQLEKELVRKPPNGYMLGDEFSDEKQDVPARVDAEGNQLGDSGATESELGRTDNRGSISPHVEDESRINGMFQQLQESLETEGSDRVVTNEAGSLELGDIRAPSLQDVRDSLDTSLPTTLTCEQISGKSPGAEDLTNQAVAIARLSTNPNLAQIAAEDQKHEAWEGTVAQGVVLERIQSFEGEDFDSDSEDDLHIVLNDGHPFYQNFERGPDGGVEGGSEDEDGQDFVLLAGNEPLDEQEWGEESSLTPDGFQGDKSLPGGGKQGFPGEERVQSGKGAGPHQGVSRSIYSGHTYHYSHHQYRYVRPGALGGGGATSGGPSNKATQSKGGNGRCDWSVPGRGFPGSQRIPGTSWGNAGPRGFQYGFEYNLPPNKTVFEIDLDSLDEKPWRHPSVDISDYFNFGFNESSWKDYCRQLAQLRFESTMQTKIKVYESGRLEQEFNSDLPPELVAPAGMYGASGEAAHHQMTTVVVTGTGGGGVRGEGREHTQGILTGRAIQVEGGFGERRPSADVRRQRIRDSDAIIIINATVDGLCKEHDEVNDFLAWREDSTKDSRDFQSKRWLNVRGKADPPLQSRASALKKEWLASGSNSQECGVRSRSVLTGDKIVAGYDIEIAQSHSRLEFNLFQGESFSPASAPRHKTPRPSTPPGRTPIQETRETLREWSHSSSMHDESQPLQEGQDNASSLVNSREKEDNSELSHSCGRCVDDQKNHGIFRAHMKGKGKKSGRQVAAAQGDRCKSKRQKVHSHKEAHSVQSSEYDQRKPSKELALRMVLDSHDYSKKVSPEHATVEYGKHQGQPIVQMENAQSDQKSGSVDIGGETIDRKMISYASRVDEGLIKPKERVELVKVKHQLRDRHGRGADAQCRRKRKEEGDKRGFPLKDKPRHRIRGQLSDLVDMKRLKCGNERERIDRDQGINDKLTNSSMSEASQRADEGMYWSRDKEHHVNVSGENPENIRLAVDCGAREQETCGRREEISQRNKSENYQHRKEGDEVLVERESTHQLRGLHNVKTERGLARHTEVGRRMQTSGDRTLLGNPRDEHVRDSTKVTCGDNKGIREGQNEPGVQETVKDQMKKCLENEDQAIHQHDAGAASFQNNIMHQGKGSRGKAFNKRKKLFANARSASEKRHRKRSRMDLLKVTDLNIDTSCPLVDERKTDQGHEDTRKGHTKTNHQSTNRCGMVLCGKPLDVSKVRSEDAECLVDYGHTERALENDTEDQPCAAKEESIHGVLSVSSQDEPKQRGRSKLERWTNQNAPEEDALEKVVVYDKKVTKKERRRRKRNKPTRKASQDIIPTSRQLLIQVNGAVLQATKVIDKDENAAKAIPCRPEENGVSLRNWNGKMKASNQDVATSNLPARVDEQQNVQQPLKMQQLDLAAKLERRKERFKLPIMEEKDVVRRLASDNHQLLDQQEVKPERPARKRRWGSS